MRVERPMKSKQVVCFISSPPREQLRHAHAAALTPALTGGCHGDDLLKSLYKSLYKNAKDPTLSILGHHGGRRKVASSRPPFSTPLRSLGEPDPETPFLVPIEHAPPLFVRIREDKISLKFSPAPLVCGADTAAPANAMGFWPNRTLFTPGFTAFEQSAMNCVRIFAKFSFSC